MLNGAVNNGCSQSMVLFLIMSWLNCICSTYYDIIILTHAYRTYEMRLKATLFELCGQKPLFYTQPLATFTKLKSILIVILKVFIVIAIELYR